VCIRLDVGGEVGVAWFPAASGGVLALEHAEAVVFAVLGSFDVGRLDLGRFRRLGSQRSRRVVG